MCGEKFVSSTKLLGCDPGTGARDAVKTTLLSLDAVVGLMTELFRRLPVAFTFVILCMTTVNGAALRQKICQVGDCKRGEFYDLQSWACQPCPSKTFSDIDSHNCTSCEPCWSENPTEGVVVKSSCSPTRDVEFGCADGYFHTETQLDSYTCTKCTVCKTGYHTKLSCSSLNDTVCEEDSSSNGGSKKITEWLIPLLAVAVPATVLIIIFALLSLNKVSSLQRKFLCHGRMEDDEVSIVETYKHLEEERKEKRKKKKMKEKAKRDAAASSS
ncbi:hypothetical protein Btru_066271 [Bulinus truncatus]|nr:hypothetical protein Btru_066271 [Bulinus truncatus]